MYQFSGKIKIFSLALIVVGALSIGWGFMSAPSTVEEAKEIMAKEAAHGDHGDHGDATHDTKAHDDHKTKALRSNYHPTKDTLVFGFCVWFFKWTMPPMCVISASNADDWDVVVDPRLFFSFFTWVRHEAHELNLRLSANFIVEASEF